MLYKLTRQARIERGGNVACGALPHRPRSADPVRGPAPIRVAELHPDLLLERNRLPNIRCDHCLRVSIAFPRSQPTKLTTRVHRERLNAVPLLADGEREEHVRRLGVGVRHPLLIVLPALKVVILEPDWAHRVGGAGDVDDAGGRGELGAKERREKKRTQIVCLKGGLEAIGCVRVGLGQERGVVYDYLKPD